jgi:hypothetical protein
MLSGSGRNKRGDAPAGMPVRFLCFPVPTGIMTEYWSQAGKCALDEEYIKVTPLKG